MNSHSPAGLAGSGQRSHSLTLGRKLAASFACLTILTLAVGILSLQRMSTMNASMVVIRDDYLPSAIASGRIALALSEVRRWESSYLLSQSLDASETQLASTQLAAAIVAVDGARAAYAPLIDPGEEQNRFNTVFDPTWAVFHRQAEQVVALVRDDHQTDALLLFHGPSRETYKALQDFAAWDMDYKQQGGLAAGAASRRAYLGTWWLLMLGLAAALGLAIAIAFGLVRHICTPLVAMTDAMRRLADKRMDTIVPCSERGDEIGRMAAAVQVFKDNMIAADRMTAEQQAQQVARLERSERLESLIGSFEAKVSGTVSALASASTEMEATALSMTGTASQTDTQAVAVAKAAEESSAGVQTVASAAEELASSITEINRQVAASAVLTDRVVGSVHETDRVVGMLAENAGKIGDVVSLITSIANQTNLLALNATIEAARAGEAGKGFAVVASEVKSLAQQTARATDEIRGQVDRVQSATGSAVEAVRMIAGMIEEVGSITTSIAAAVEEQGAATAEIARNVQRTFANTRTVTTNIAGVSRAANDTGIAANQVLSSAGDLSRQAEDLSREMGSFIAGVREA